jgi:arginyl-tRNA synthetase
LRTKSYEFFANFYEQLEVHPFDRYIPESEVTELGYFTVIEQSEKGVFEKSEGAIIFDGEKYGLHKRVFVNSEGLPTYETKDVGLSLTKWKDYHFDESIIITANEQSQYMQVVIKAIEQFEPEPAQKTKHITHGVVKLTGGVKMSSRRGSVLYAKDIIDSATEAGKQSGSAKNNSIVLASIKYAFLKNKIGGDIIYDPLESISLEGNSGPYLQYAHARAQSILRKSKITNPKLESSVGLDKFERSLVRKLSEYTGIIESSVAELAPHMLCGYLYELAQQFNRFYENSSVIGSDREELRIALVKKYTSTLRAGLYLLGIDAPDKM